MRRRFRLAVAFLAALGFSSAGDAAQTADLHELAWYVHVDLITVARPLTFYEGLVDDWVARASDRLKGNHGPFDSPCCVALTKISVSPFGTTGDGLDLPDSQADIAAIAAIGLPGSRAFIVDSLAWCGGPGSAIGCGLRPVCTGNPNDDPNLWLILTMDAHEVFDSAADTLVHERGHNACLAHASANTCQIMRAAVGGACLSQSECSDYQNGRTGSGGTCECHASSGAIEPDGLPCNEVASGTCSGGLCGGPDSDAAVELFASGGTESIGGAAPDSSLLASGISGGWVDLGVTSPGVEIMGLAYADTRATLYGVTPTAGDDELLIIDPATGAATATVGSLSGIQGVMALAFDPGPTGSSTDDRLLALKDRPGMTEQLLAIDPDDAAVTVLGGLTLGGAFDGLAYDSENGSLYASSPFPGGLYEIDSSCAPCSVTQVPGLDRVRFGSSLAYSPETEALYLIGYQSGPRLLYDTIDANTLASPPTIGIDGYTAGGLAVKPMPELSLPLALGAGVALLAALTRRRAR